MTLWREWAAPSAPAEPWSPIRPEPKRLETNQARGPAPKSQLGLFPAQAFPRLGLGFPREQP
jgi:hypothetical protein